MLVSNPTTTTFTPPETPPRPAARTESLVSAVYLRHLAVVLEDSGGLRQYGTHELEAACGALRAIMESCTEYGVDSLTLVPPSNACGRELLRDALARSSTAGMPSFCLTILERRDGREELLECARALASAAIAGTVNPDGIDTAAVEAHLHASRLPPVDFLISIGNGERLSGALLWHCAYAEFLFQPQPWWSTTREHISAALADYALRCRKFGGLV